MPAFNPPPQGGDVQNFTGASRGVDFSNAGAGLDTLGRGLADAFTGVIQGTDQIIKQDINNDVDAGYDAINKEFGIDDATELASDLDNTGTATDGSGRPVPQAIQDAGKSLQSLQGAYASGNLPQSYYWARMNSLVRNLRAQYPGYRDYIDDQVAKTAGGQPANELRQSLFSEWGKEDPATKRFSEFEDAAAKAGTLPPDYYSRQNSGNPYTFTELQSYVAGVNAQRASTAASIADLSLASSQGSLNKTAAGTTFRGIASQTVQKALSDVQAGAGLDYAKLSSRIATDQATLSKGGSLSADEIQQLKVMTQNLEATMRSQLDIIGKNSWDGSDPNKSFFATLSSDEYNKTIDDAMAPIKMLETGLDDPTLGLIGAGAAWLKASQDNATKDLFQNVPVAQTMAALSQGLGPQGAAAIMTLNPTLFSAATTTIANYLNAKTQLPPPPGTAAPDFNTDLQTYGQKAPDLGSAEVANWKGQAQNFADGKLTEDQIGKSVDYLFGPKNLNIFAQMDPTSKLNYFTQIASPQVTQQMLKLRDAGDTARWNEYKQWVLNGFQALSREQFSSLAQFNLDKNQLQIAWNPQTQAFVSVPNPKYTNPALSQYNGLSPDVIANRMQDQQTEVKAELDKLNATINTVKPILAADNVDLTSTLGALYKQFPTTQRTQSTMSDDVLNALPPDQTLVQPGGTGDTDNTGEPPPDPNAYWENNLPFQPQFVAPGNEQGDENTEDQQNFARNQQYVQGTGNQYNTPLAPAAEQQFRQWVKTNNVPFDVNAKVSDYDMRGFWQALQNGDPKAVNAIDPNDGKLHYPDYWKTPYHKTFSNESQWATPDAPHWTDDDKLIDNKGNILFDDRAPKTTPLAHPVSFTPAETEGLRSFIGNAEAKGDYNLMEGEKQPTNDLTGMSVSDVQNLQKQWVAKGHASGAAGKYQIISSTLNDAVKAGIVSPTDTFNEATQDKLANYLLAKRGYSEYKSGKISAEEFADNLAHEWASLPLSSGKSVYDGVAGNKALVSRDNLLAAITGATPEQVASLPENFDTMNFSQKVQHIEDLLRIIR